jgi:hypothetical protein
MVGDPGFGAGSDLDAYITNAFISGSGLSTGISVVYDSVVSGSNATGNASDGSEASVISYSSGSSDGGGVGLDGEIVVGSDAQAGGEGMTNKYVMP